RRLAEEPLPAPWYGYVRFSEELADQEFVHRLRDNGCVMLQLGLESGDQAVLDAMEKGIDLRTAGAALRCLKKAGIGAYVYLLFGTPWENQESARKTLQFVVEHADSICGLNAAIFNMPSHSAAAGDYAVRSFSEGDLSLYTDFEHPRGWNRSAVRRFLQYEFRSHPAVRRIVNAVPPAFTSNHAPFFHPSFHKVRSHAHSTAL
ncbi:MAG: radical SAM protein, partial [candidate division KSB1 bacterium]|nr:radical SAM protein [candidate division KSB1 bacterium]